MATGSWTAVFVTSFLLGFTLVISEDAAPKIYYLHITSDIKYRFATTLVTSKVVNADNVSREVVFDVTLPNEAFMTNFTLEVDDKIHIGEVKEKEEAKKKFEQAKRQGQTAGYIGAKPRETNKFNIQVNVEALGSVTFNLTYQEVLRRKTGKYCHVIYIDPGQPVEDMLLEVAIQESRDITTLNVPPLRNDILTDVNIDATDSNDIAIVQRPTPRSAYILYSPSVEDQKRTSDTGISGQFVVEYDVDRQTDAGDLLVVNGYFVHFFAVEGIEPLPKDVLFILDKSGSMSGRKIRQLREAMLNILDDVQEGDRFNIMTFDSSIRYWVQGELIPASTENVNNAKAFVDGIVATGSTNIDMAMTEGIKLLSSTRNDERARVLIFLTDGQPTTGERNPAKILENVCRFNEVKIPVFSLAFGEGADYNFVKKMAAQNNGLGRKIYEDSDASLQIEGFYDEISTVLLKNVSFTYLNGTIQEDTLTQDTFNTFFEGSEIMVAGRLADINTNSVGVTVSGDSQNGIIKLTLPNEIIPDTDLNLIQDEDFEKITENLWAYLTIKQKLKLKEASNSKTEQDKLKQEILEMSLKYNFVTPLTSMVVTLTNDSDTKSLDEFHENEKLPVAIGSGVASSQGSAYNVYQGLPTSLIARGQGMIKHSLPSVFNSGPVFYNWPSIKGAQQFPLPRPRTRYRTTMHTSMRKYAPPSPTTTTTATTTTTTSTTARTSNRGKKRQQDTSFIVKVFGINDPLCLDLGLTAGKKYKILEDRQSGIQVHATTVNSGSLKSNKRRRRRKPNVKVTSIEVDTERPSHTLNFNPASYNIDGAEQRWITDTFPLTDFYQNITFAIDIHPEQRSALGTEDELRIYTDLSARPMDINGLLEKFSVMRGRIVKTKTRGRRTIAKLKLRLGGQSYKLRARLYNNPISGVSSCWSFGKNVKIANILNIQPALFEQITFISK